MSEKRYEIDIGRSYDYYFEGKSQNLEIPNCNTHTYAFQTIEEYRYIFLVDEFEDINLLGLKFHRGVDYEKKDKYNILINLKNPYRLFATLFCIIKKDISKQFPQHSFIMKGEPTPFELEKKNECDNDTKRFKFYKKLFAEFISSGNYSFQENKEKSILLLLNSSAAFEDFAKIENFLDGYGLNL